MTSRLSRNQPIVWTRFLARVPLKLGESWRGRGKAAARRRPCQWATRLAVPTARGPRGRKRPCTTCASMLLPSPLALPPPLPPPPMAMTKLLTTMAAGAAAAARSMASHCRPAAARERASGASARADLLADGVAEPVPVVRHGVGRSHGVARAAHARPRPRWRLHGLWGVRGRRGAASGRAVGVRRSSGQERANSFGWPSIRRLPESQETTT